jgi:hypothetical protein
MISAVPYGTGPRILRYPALRAGLLSGRPCGTLRYEQLSQLGGGREMHIVPNGCGCDPGMIQQSRKSPQKCRNFQGHDFSRAERNRTDEGFSP